MEISLPDSVKRQGERARELQAGLNAPKDGNGQDTTTAPQAGELETLRAENARLHAAQSVLQGKYNAELPRERARARELEAKLAETAQEAERLRQEKVNAPPPPVDTSTLDLTQHFSKEELETYDEGLLRTVLGKTLKSTEAMRATVLREAQEAARAEVKPLKEFHDSELERRRQELASDRETAQAKFMAELSVAIPNWEGQNEDPGFLSWLDKYDATLAGSRMQYLQTAHSQADAAKVIEVFKAYRESREIGAAKKAPSLKLDPGPGSGGELPPSSEKRKWTRAEIAQFNHDAGPGRKYVGREAERRQIEADIQMASKEGRIVG